LNPVLSKKENEFIEKENLIDAETIQNNQNSIEIITVPLQQNKPSNKNSPKGILNSKPIGLLDLNKTLGFEDSKSPKNFFIQSFLLMQDSNFQNATIIDLNPYWGKMQNSKFQHVVSRILIYNS
jgi:hypothetical protein